MICICDKFPGDAASWKATLCTTGFLETYYEVFTGGGGGVLYLCFPVRQTV